ncbi:lytic transglycosylase domain-containing protein [Microbispora sp. NBRC 16548]|uniref:aggregation-promoting factor C-terminal-like domain-containing protein n=1 Tax=Microbispora sp. NBRC 16548 TaxID=3030994 RepID=UPI00160B7353|nr:lytic transglycosylase domain-containing protein [Microbispora sp. NBRC 16548]
MSSGQQLKDRPRASRPRRGAGGRSGSGRLTPKRIAILGVSVAVLAGGTAFVVRTSIEHGNAPKQVLGPDSFLALDPNAPDPETDILKEQAVQALRKDRLQSTRDDRKKGLDPVEIAQKAPGGGGFTPADFPPGSTPDPGSNKALGKQMAEARGWGGEWGCLEKLWDRESHWNERAMNRYSGAYGIPQALPGSKMASAGSDWQTNPATQIKWGLGYIAGRYKTPCGAWGHSQSTGWY